MKMMKNIAYAALVGMLLLSGCTQPQNQSLLSARSDTESTLKALENVPFAYDLTIDTISYNSCVGSDLKNSDLHGIRMGANEGFVDPNGMGAVKAGLKLRSAFLQYAVKTLNPNYPSSVVVPSQVQYLLQNSTVNKDISVQYGVRTALDLKLVPDTIQPTTAPKQGRDGVYEVGILSQDPILSNITKGVQFGANRTVLSEGARIYNASLVSSPKAFEASFGYSNNVDETFAAVAGTDDGTAAGEEYSDKVRTKFNAGTNVLAITYGSQVTTTSTDTVGGLDSPLRPVASSGDLTKAYGRSFSLGFTTRNSSIPSWRKNILNKVVEKNLEDGQPAAGVTWTCDYAVIMKTNHFNNPKPTEPACSELQAADLENPIIAAKVKNFRRQYPQQTWGIGLYYAKNTVYNPATRLANPKLCLINKSTDCYLPTTNVVVSAPTEDIGVQYDESQECYLSRYERMGVTYIGNKSGDAARRLGRCAQYASICTRSSASY